MFFQIWHSVFHYLTKKLFCVAPSATELNFPFNWFRIIFSFYDKNFKTICIQVDIFLRQSGD